MLNLPIPHYEIQRHYRPTVALLRTNSNFQNWLRAVRPKFAVVPNSPSHKSVGELGITANIGWTACSDKY